MESGFHDHHSSDPRMVLLPDSEQQKRLALIRSALGSQVVAILVSDNANV